MARLTDQEFEAKWTLGFADNTMQDITERTFRDFKTDLKDSYANLKALNVRQVKGATYPLPYTDSVRQIPPAYRIVGMLALAKVGTTAADAATLATLPGPATLQLVAAAGGDVEALVDEQPGTTATVKATWELVKEASQPGGALSQHLTLAQAQAIQRRQVVAGCTYLLDFGIDPLTGLAQTVSVRGISGYLFDVEGTVEIDGLCIGIQDIDVFRGTYKKKGGAAYDDTALAKRVTALEQAGGGAGNSGPALVTFDKFSISDQKRTDVIADYAAAGLPVEETDSAYFDVSFTDDYTVTGVEYEYRCTPTVKSGATVWKWRCYKQGK